MHAEKDASPVGAHACARAVSPAVRTWACAMWCAGCVLVLGRWSALTYCTRSAGASVHSIPPPLLRRGTTLPLEKVQPNRALWERTTHTDTVKRARAPPPARGRARDTYAALAGPAAGRTRPHTCTPIVVVVVSRRPAPLCPARNTVPNTYTGVWCRDVARCRVSISRSRGAQDTTARIPAAAPPPERVNQRCKFKLQKSCDDDGHGVNFNTSSSPPPCAHLRHTLCAQQSAPSTAC